MTDTGDYSALTISKDDNDIVTVTISRPDIHNAFDDKLIAELSDCFTRLGEAKNVSIIVLTGEGKSFCAGADITWMRSMVDYTYDENIVDSQKLADMFWIINSCPKPVVGRVNGAAFGGGVGLVACCDIAIAAENTKFSFSEVKLGIIPSVVSPYVLAKIGPGHARKLFVTGERFDAATALKIGLVHQAVPLEQLDEAVAEINQLLLYNGPNAMHEAKVLVSKWLEMDPDEFRSYTVNKIAELRVSPEGKEGLAGFLEKRKPRFRGD
jgi:methylglutaconyl-CoA hydratase